jgi:hypothetical protein
VQAPPRAEELAVSSKSNRRRALLALALGGGLAVGLALARGASGPSAREPETKDAQTSGAERRAGHDGARPEFVAPAVVAPSAAPVVADSVAAPAVASALPSAAAPHPEAPRGDAAPRAPRQATRPASSGAPPEDAPSRPKGITNVDNAGF